MWLCLLFCVVCISFIRRSRRLVSLFLIVILPGGDMTCVHDVGYLDRESEAKLSRNQIQSTQ